MNQKKAWLVIGFIFLAAVGFIFLTNSTFVSELAGSACGVPDAYGDVTPCPPPTPCQPPASITVSCSVNMGARAKDGTGKITMKASGVKLTPSQDPNTGKNAKICPSTSKTYQWYSGNPSNTGPSNTDSYTASEYAPGIYYTGVSLTEMFKDQSGDLYSVSTDASCQATYPKPPKPTIECTGVSSDPGTAVWNATANLTVGQTSQESGDDFAFTWKDATTGPSETLSYNITKPTNEKNSVKATDGTNSGSDSCSVLVCPGAPQFDVNGWQTTTFGGQEDIKLYSNPKKSTDPSNGCAENRNISTGAFSVDRNKSDPYFDAAANCVKPPFGSTSGGGGFNEQFNPEGQYFRDVVSANSVYAAYPYSTAPKGSQVDARCSAPTLKNQCLMVTVNKGDTPVQIPIWDRGPGKKEQNKLDLSLGAISELGISAGGSVYDAQLKPCQ